MQTTYQKSNQEKRRIHSSLLEKCVEINPLKNAADVSGKTLSVTGEDLNQPFSTNLAILANAVKK